MLDKTKEDAAIDEAAIREEVRAIKDREGLSWQHIADESGVKHGTLTPFMGNTYRGDTGRVAADLQRWLETRREREHTAAVLPDVPSFIMTPTAQDVLSTLSFAQSAPDFGVIVGGAGIGKTTAIEHYARRNSNVWFLTADPSMEKAANVLSILAEELGVSERRNAFISRAISARVRGANGLVIVDEAQHLEAKAFDQLRTTVLDLGKCGIAVAGNESMLARLQGSADKRTQAFAQLHSRVGIRKMQHASKAADICLLLDAWGISDDDVKTLLKSIARKPGALRIMNKVIRLATMVSAAGSPSSISRKDVNTAWSQLSSVEI
ncbi:AAA family ATPase [Ancylobacter defluvii]|uniref:Transposase n=1 Tax=Ancylobacter defluvii TaxID=1282440 RepID=A0A9W6NCM2_9HYPH|nr:AAA family ATPase [Ancylobacter defluvii]MBS7586440.1 AAA family ATPase [Ancylobacter defluvii]GLK85721.1 transposase [Ancylobacter defluvii]